MPLRIERNDITKMTTTAIVNAANKRLEMGGGVCGAIFKAAGIKELTAACRALAPIETGAAIVTAGFGLTNKYIIHTAGPIYQDGKHNEANLLASCYKNSLNLAKSLNCNSIAFPLIATGIYGYPKEEALAIATKALSEWLEDNDMEVILVVFDKKSFQLSLSLQKEVAAYIDEYYVKQAENRFPERLRLKQAEYHEKTRVSKSSNVISEQLYDEGLSKGAIGDFTDLLDESFSNSLLRLIEAKGKTEAQVYKKANIDRRLFSKIRTNKNYQPSKKTAVALAIALELSLSETNNFLMIAGYALSSSVLFDVIVEYFIKSKNYNIFEINNVLFEYDQPLLGCDI